MKPYFVRLVIISGQGWQMEVHHGFELKPAAKDAKDAKEMKL